MSTTTGLHTILATAISQEEKKLLQSFPENEARPVIEKLHDLVRNLKGAKRYQSVGIFVSPHASKVYYFNYSDQEIKSGDRRITSRVDSILSYLYYTILFTSNEFSGVRYS